MVDFNQVHPLGNLAALVAAHRHDGADAAPVKIEVYARTVCAQLFASNGNAAKLASKLAIKDAPGQAATTRNFAALPLSPGQWLAVAKNPAVQLATKLAKSAKGLGHASDQSDSRVCFRVSGPMARQLMSRGCRLDLNSPQAQAGFCAQTVMAQVGVLLHQLDDSPSYELYVYSGFARSFCDWLCHAAAQFGYEVSVI